jgi:hypothetical protein
MRVALLAPGPSLERTWRPEAAAAFDLVIAVNFAARLFPSDWIATIDTDTVSHVLVGDGHLPRHGWITRRRLQRDLVRLPAFLCRAWSALSLPWYSCAHLRSDFPRALARALGEPHCPWTFPNALRAARDFAGDDPESCVEVHGFDLALRTCSVAGGGCTFEHDIARWRMELPWVRAAWSPACTNHGAATPEAMRYVRGDTDDLRPALDSLPQPVLAPFDQS